MDSSKKRKLEEPEEAAEEEEQQQQQEEEVEVQQQQEEEVEVEEEEEEEPEDEQQEDEGEDEEREENGNDEVDVSTEEIRAMIEPFSKERVVDMLISTALRDPELLREIKKLANRDVAHRKIFVRGLGKEITVQALRGIFAQYGDITECLVIKDKQRGKSKGYGFVTFRHIEGARRALAQPNKNIDGRMIMAQLASVGPSHQSSDQRWRKIYVGNVPSDLSAEKLLAVFSKYGEIEEGPVGFDKVTGKSRGYAIFFYKFADSAKKALKEPIKTIDGHKVNCKLATPEGFHKAKSKRLEGGGKAQSGGIVGAAPNNISYSALSGLLPLNHGLLGQHSLLAAQGLLTAHGLAGLNPSLAHQLALGSSLGSSLDPSLNASLAASLNVSLPQGGSQGLSQSSLASYGLHGLGVYGSQLAGLGGSGVSSLYGGQASSIGSQLHGSGQGYTSGQRAGGRSHSLSGYFGP